MDALPASQAPAAVRRLVDRLRRAQPSDGVVDTALAVAFGLALVTERWSAAERIGSRMPAALALAAVSTAALAARRRFPLAAYLVGSLAMLVEARFVVVSAVTPNATLVEAYSFGLYATRARARFGPVVAVAGVLTYFAVVGRLTVADAAGPLVLWTLAWAFGYGSARRAEERDAARSELRRRLLADERAHIARELHDLVGHSLNVMLVQAGAARRVLERDAGQARDLLTSLESTGREAFDELDRVLGLLRESGPAAGRPDAAVPPGLADLPRLTERIAATGLAVTLQVDPGVRDLPRSVDLSAYRIVQEALTNTVRHAQAGAVDVDVRRRGRALAIEVTDDGQGPANGYAAGRGLLGISERVVMFGGSLEHGGGERGGFRLCAVLPVPQ